jgi:hypothetical protein
MTRLAILPLAALLITPVAAAQAAGKPLPATTTTPKVYVIPMNGQMGTDISKQPYEDIIEDARKAKPDIVVFELESADIDNNFYLKNDDAREAGVVKLDEYRDLIKMLREKLDAPQVMWVHDSVGFGSLMALSWPDMYMKSDARLWGLSRVSDVAKGWSDPDVAAKMMAAWTGIGKGFLQQGGYPVELGDAMMTPTNVLSADWEGRAVKWAANTDGQWVVDSSDKSTANFSATLAEDTGLCDGLADSLDDLMFLLGYREYEKLDSGEKRFEQYKEDWRRMFDRCKEWMIDAETSDEGVKGLGQIKNAYEKVVAAMKQYPAIEQRFRSERLPGRLQLEVEIERIKEQIRGARNSGGTAGGRGGRGGGASAPGGGPGAR